MRVSPVGYAHRMTRLALLLALMACGHTAPRDEQPAADICAPYHEAFAAARRTRGTAAVEAPDACGCILTLDTTSEQASVLSRELGRVRRENRACWNACDQPCQPQMIDVCDGYRHTVQAARATPGDVAVEARNACGCTATLHTTDALAADLTRALARADSDGRRCAINCDQPCGPDDRR